MLGHIPARRHPMQLFIAGMCAVSGVPILVGGPQPGSVSAALPPALLYLWAGVLAVGGLMVVAAAVIPPLAAVFFEFIADVPLSLMCAVHTGAVLIVGGSRGLVSASLAFGAALAFAARAVQNGRILFEPLLARRKQKRARNTP